MTVRQIHVIMKVKHLGEIRAGFAIPLEATEAEIQNNVQEWAEAQIDLSWREDEHGPEIIH